MFSRKMTNQSASKGEMIIMLKNKKLQRTLAVLALVGFMGTTSLTTVSEAASMPPQRPAQTQMQNQPRPNNNQSRQQGPNNEVKAPNRDNDQRGPEQNRNNRQEQRPEMRRDNPAPERRREPERRPMVRRTDYESHSDTGNLVTGLIIGGILGAVIANNS
jgi:hypothetical protein